MNEVWDRVYKSDNTFFGDEPSNFALLCFNYMKINNVQKILELGAGHGRDAIITLIVICFPLLTLSTFVFFKGPSKAPVNMFPINTLSLTAVSIQ
jgi:hypothetical protein